MSMTYGTIIVCGNYQGDLEKIARALNCWNFDAEDLKFEAHDAYIAANDSCAVYPTTVPSRLWIEFDDGRQIPYNESDVDLEEQDGWDFIDPEEIDLETISKTISPLLTGGSIELVAVGHERLESAYIERLIVRSDGYAERHYCGCNACASSDWTTQATESYQPGVNGEAAQATKLPLLKLIENGAA